MKPVFVIAAILSSLSMASYAQIDFGPKIGWNANHLYTNLSDYTSDMKNGVQGGIFLRLDLGRIYLQPESYFALKRTDLYFDIDEFDPNDPTSLAPVKQTIRLTTVDIPMLMGFYLIDFDLCNLRVHGGPVASYILNKDIRVNINGVDESDRIRREDFRDASWSFKVGAGLDILFLSVDVSYELGLQELFSINSFANFYGRSNMFYVSLGLKIL